MWWVPVSGPHSLVSLHKTYYWNCVSLFLSWFVSVVCGRCQQSTSRDRENVCAECYMQCVYKWMAQFQKLTRNLFLTLHGHNVHRQQRQLSEFLMRYQQFAFHAYCGAAGSVYKMAPQQEKAFCVLRFEVSRSVITVQHEFRARFRKDAPLIKITWYVGHAAKMGKQKVSLKYINIWCPSRRYRYG